MFHNAAADKGSSGGPNFKNSQIPQASWLADWSLSLFFLTTTGTGPPPSLRGQMHRNETNVATSDDAFKMQSF